MDMADISQEYNTKVDRKLPLVNVGRRDAPTYVPAEFVEILPGQSLKAKLSLNDQSAMINFSCRTASVNAMSITTGGRQLLSLDANPLLARFGITIDKGLMTVQGRELSPPRIVYTGGASEPESGSWNMKFRKVFRPGAQIARWNFLSFKGRPAHHDTRTAANSFADWMAKGVGININQKPLTPGGLEVDFTEQAIKAAFDKLSQGKPQLVLVFLRTKDAARYSQIKQLGDCNYGFHTVCLTDKVFSANLKEYFTNVGLKVNMKFGGVNHKLQAENSLISQGKTMVAGYDVTHPTNLSQGAPANAPSIVGLVASVDSSLSQWPAYVWNMSGKTEMLDNTLVDGFNSRLALWQKHNKDQLPSNIVIFRDGVSEGQFNQVLEKELPFIRKACSEKYKAGTAPRITLIVSVKRHQTRFYPTDANHQRNKSPKEGTIVDRGVTSVRYWDFFLQAHAAIKGEWLTCECAAKVGLTRDLNLGTARPAHYTVLLDEIFRADYGSEAANQLEKLTHDMCYMYGRATKAVSICPPAYYADLVCTRARAHNANLFEGSDSASVSSGSSAALSKVHNAMQDTMYYV
jgi:eukaryotic translation initiation factor 2C